MNVSTIADVLEMQHDDPIEAIRGTVKKMFDFKTGTSKRGAWSLQSFILQDGREEMKVTMKDREELMPRDWENTEIVMTAKKGGKGYTGLYAKDDDYNNNVTRIIWVTATATIEVDDSGGSPRQQTRQPQQRQAAPPRQQTQERAPAPAQQRPPVGRPGPKVLIGKIAALYVTVDAAARVAKDHIEARAGAKMTIEEFTSMRASLFIQACMEKTYYDVEVIRALGAAEPKKAAAPPPPPAPEPEPEPPADDDSIPF